MSASKPYRPNVGIALFNPSGQVLIGRRFRVGEVECYGVVICEPCLSLEQRTRPGIIRDLVHRGGINADILTDGVISVGDEVTAL